MQQDLNNLQDVFTELNINVPPEDEPQECVITNWKDITSFLDQATQDFDIGQLVHLQSFTLFDAMSAIEIMNPRMDTGMIENTTTPEFDVTRFISAKQALYIMDSLVTREMAWISGHSLSQTVYTCIYFSHLKTLNELPKPTIHSTTEEIVHGVLRSYINTTAKCCHSIFTEMTNGNVYEEEDFTTNLFGLTFQDQSPDFMVLNDIDVSIQLLNHLLTLDLEDKHVFQQMLYRMNMRKSYFLSLTYLSQLEESYLSQAKTELIKVMDALSHMDLTVSDTLNEAFDTNINRKLTSQTPPRPVELVSEEESFEAFKLLIERLISICDVIDYPSTTSLMSYFLHFGAKQPYADAFSRSKLNTLFYHNQRIFGKKPVSQFMIESIREIVQPPVWWTTPQVKLAPTMNPVEFMQAHDTFKAYLEKVSLVFIEYFKINCHNRSRQRRMLCKIVKEWEILQEEAAAVDEMFHHLQRDDEGNPIDTPYYFSSWAYHLKLTMIEKILFLGFELDLYGTHEYIMVYWYIQCVLGSHAYLLDRILGYAVQEPVIMRSQLIVHALKSLSEAMFKLMATLKHTDQVNPHHDFDDEETRYGQRFKPFIELFSPPHPAYELYAEAVTTDDLQVPQMKQILKHDFMETKKIFEKILLVPDDMYPEAFIKEYKDLIRVTVANTIGLNFIGTTKIDLQFKYHPWFPVINKI